MTDTGSRSGVMLDRRRAGLVLAAGLAAPAVARAQSAWPKGRVIRIVVPFTPAGATDILARLLAERFSQYWGASVIVENKPGAGGNIGADLVAKSPPDGNTLMMFSVSLTTNPFLYDKLPYDAAKDFDPVSLVAMVPNILVTGKNLKVSSVKELVEYGRANPGVLTYASSGTGTSIHLSGALFAKLAGIKMVHVPYKGSAPALQDLMGGQVDIMFDNITSALPHVRSGMLRCFGITTQKKSPFAPDFEPIAATVPGYDTSSWFALFAPAGTPKDIVARIQTDARQALAETGVKEKLAVLAAEAVGSSPAELGAFVRAESEKWGTLIRETGAKAE